MPKNTYGEWDRTAGNNSDIDGTDIAENCLAGNVNNALRSIMAQLAARNGITSQAAGYTAALADRDEVHRCTATLTVALTAAATLGNGWALLLLADGGVITVDPNASETIDGSATLTIPDGGSALIVCDGTGFYSLFNPAAAEVANDATPQLGGDLDVNGNSIVSASNGDVTIEPDGTGSINLNAADVLVEEDIVHAGDTDNKITFGTDTQNLQTGGSSRLDISDSGVRLGGSNARVTTVLDEDAMGSDSATALATQQSIKAYVDGQSGAATIVAEELDTYLPDSSQTEISIDISGGTYSAVDINLTNPSLGSATSTAFQLHVANSGGDSNSETISASGDFSSVTDVPDFYIRIMGLKTGQIPYVFVMSTDDEVYRNAGTLSTSPFMKTARMGGGSLSEDAAGILTANITEIVINNSAGNTFDAASVAGLQVIGYP